MAVLIVAVRPVWPAQTAGGRGGPAADAGGEGGARVGAGQRTADNRRIRFASAKCRRRRSTRPPEPTCCSARSSRLGLQNVRIDKAGNVIGDRPGATPRPRVVIAAHLDTVFPEGTNDKVDPERERAARTGHRRQLPRTRRARGDRPGDERRRRVRTPGTVTFVANVGEEGLGDLRGVKALFGDTLRGQIDRFVVDRQRRPVTSAPSRSAAIRYRVTFKGPGGHSFAEFGTPNPANALGRAVARIAEFQRARPARERPSTSGRIGGGTSVNAIPSEAWMEVDLRSSDARSTGRTRGAVSTRGGQRGRRGERAVGRTPGVITVSKELVGEQAGRRDVAVGADRADGSRLWRARSGSVAQPSESSSDANLPMSLEHPGHCDRRRRRGHRVALAKPSGSTAPIRGRGRRTPCC